MSDSKAAINAGSDPATIEWHTSVKECVSCPECAFTFAADHQDEDGGYSCPACAEDELSEAVVALIAQLTEYAADQRHAREGVARGSSVEQRYRGRAQGFEQAISTVRFLFYGEEVPCSER